MDGIGGENVESNTARGLLRTLVLARHDLSIQVLASWGPTRTRLFLACHRAVLLLTALIGFAPHAIAQSLPVAPVPGAHGSTTLGLFLEILKDRAGKLQIENVRQLPSEEKFVRSSESIPNFGYTKSAYWFHFVLADSSVGNEDLLLEIRFPSLDRIDFYSPKTDAGNDGAYEVKSLGDTFPWAERDEKHRSFVFRISKPTTRGPHDFYFRVVSSSVLSVPAYLWKPGAFARNSHHQQMLSGLYYGLIVALALYNLMLFFSIRDRAYLFYVLYVTFFGLSLFAFDGLAFEYIWPDSVWWANHGLAFALALALTFGTQFVQTFLEVPRYAPRIAVIQKTVVWLGAVLAVLAATGWWLSLADTLRAISALGLVFAATATYVAIRATMSGYRPARFFLVAFSALLISIVLGALRNFTLLPTTAVSLYGLHVGLVLDVLLLSFALADRINTLRRERIRETERLDRLKRFVAPRIGELIIAGEVDDPLRTHRREIPVVFTDLRGFTNFAESVEPEEVMQVLREYHETLGRLVNAHEGTIEHFAGDGVMILFNDPVPVENHELVAIRMALEMRDAVKLMEVNWTKQGYRLGFGVGVANGYATLGAIGFEGRRDYGAIGSVTNLAARLCGEAKAGQILISQQVFSAVEKAISADFLGELSLKGFYRTIPAYNVLSMAK